MTVVITLAIATLVLLLHVHLASFYTKVANDYDLYGIKVAMNDRLMLSVDNLGMNWYPVPVLPNDTAFCTINYNKTTCDFVYSIVIPASNVSSFVYNCIDLQGHNVIGFFSGNDTCTFNLNNEQVVSNYSTQDNFVINIDGQGTGVYGFADDFIFYYELHSTFQLTVWPNTLNISPRALDIGSNVDYGVVVGYCQSTPILALECGFIVLLNRSLSCPIRTNSFSNMKNITFSFSDPRISHYITQSRVYSPQTVMSVSIAWRTRRVLIGIQSLNLVLLYSFDQPQYPISTRQNGIGLMGFGKSVAWLDDQGEKAVILANSYSYSTYQWISSFVHVYDIQSDGFSDSTQPILVYPNSQQILFRVLYPSFIRLVCSAGGHVTIFDNLGNEAIIMSSPAGTYPDTNTEVQSFSSIAAPCIRGTYRNYSGIELCYPCPNGTASSNCSQCTSNDSFCPYGAIEEISYSAFKSIEQDQEYPESPENTVFDDILMQNMFSFNTQSRHCLLVSPLFWVFLIIGIGTIVAIMIAIHEVLRPGTHAMRDRTKEIFKKMDLIGEGELWIGGLVSAAVLVLVISAYVSSNGYFRQYPIEGVTGDNSFMCDVTMRNAKFSTTTQMVSNVRHPNKNDQTMFDMLNLQEFTLNMDLVQTAFTCQDSLIVQRVIGYTLTDLPIWTCQTSHNDSILSLAIPLPAHDISVQLTLPGSRTIGAIRLGLSGPPAVSTDSRYTRLGLNFASTFVSSSLDQVLASSALFTLQLTQIINRTAPLNSDGLPSFSAIWSPSFSVKVDELFTNESRYTFFQRTQTNVSVTIGQSIFYVSNVQEPIARQTEIIFRNLLFTIVVLELFGLVFLIIKLLILPLFHTIFVHIQYLLKNKRTGVSEDDLTMVVVKKSNLPPINQPRLIKKSRRRWSAIAGTVPASHE